MYAVRVQFMTAVIPFVKVDIQMKSGQEIITMFTW